MSSARPATAALIAVNLFLAAGPFVLDWTLNTLVLVLWAELGVVGFFTILKMLFADEKGELGKSRSYQVIFFLSHFASFVILYAALLRVTVADDPIDMAAIVGILIAVPLFMVSHGLSFKLNYLDRKESTRISSVSQMWEPYKRILPVQCLVLVGAFILSRNGESPFALLVLVLAKLVVDLAAHLYLHRNAD